VNTAPFFLYPSLPDVPANYVVWNGANVLYAGQTQSLSLRFRNHGKLAKFEELGATTITWAIESDKKKRLSCEKNWITTYNPPLNRPDPDIVAVPFNMIGEDGDLVNQVREKLEIKLGTRLSAVQVARIVFREALERNQNVLGGE
jgi:hypothetical protein